MTKDYRPTIFLPQTDFPMKGDLPTREPKLLKHWEDINLYSLLQKKRKDVPFLFFMMALLMLMDISIWDTPLIKSLRM